MLAEQLTETGVMDAARLYESPLTDISQQGPEALLCPPKYCKWCAYWMRFGNGRRLEGREPCCSLAQDNGSAAVQEYPLFDVHFQGTRQGQALHITPQ